MTGFNENDPIPQSVLVSTPVSTPAMTHSVGHQVTITLAIGDGKSKN